METETEKKPNKTIKNLPQEILMMFKFVFTKINSCFSRNNAQIVCNQYVFKHDKCSPVDKYLPFSNNVPDLMDCKDQKIKLTLWGMDLNGTDAFWKEKGSSVESLEFVACKFSLDMFTKIVRKCKNLKHLHIITFSSDEYDEHQLLVELNSRRVVNRKLTSIYFATLPTSIIRGYHELAHEFKHFITTVIKVFPNVKKIHLDKSPSLLMSLLPEIGTFLAKSKRQIIFSLYGGGNHQEIVFNYSKAIPISYAADNFMLGTKAFSGYMTDPTQLYYYFIQNPLLVQLRLTVVSDFDIPSNTLALFDELQSHKMKKLEIVRGTEFPHEHESGINYFIPAFAKSFPNLTDLNIYSISYATYKLICNSMTQLEDLRIKNFEDNCHSVPHSDDNISKLTKLKTLTIPPNFIMMENKISLDNLESLTIVFDKCACQENKAIFPIDFQRFCCPELNRLEFAQFKLFDTNKISPRQCTWELTNEFTRQLESILPNFPKLKTIVFNGAQYEGRRPSDSSMEEIFEKYQSNPLTSVNLNGCLCEPAYLKKAETTSVQKFHLHGVPDADIQSCSDDCIAY